MTLALYGKSRRRQGGLILAGFVALMVAMLAGVATFSSAFAHAATISDDAECKSNGTYTVDWEIKDDVSKRLFLDSVTATAGTTGTFSNNGENIHDGNRMLGQTTNIPGNATSVKLTIKVYWAENSNGTGNRHPSSGTITYEKTQSLGGDCEPPSRKVRVHKVVQGSNAPSKTFAYTISPAGVSDTVSSSDSDDHEVPEDVAQVVKETESLSNGWSFVKYSRKKGLDDNCSGGSWTDATNQGNGISIPSDDDDYTVCIYNKYAPEPELEIEKVSQGEGPYGLNDTFWWDIIFTTSGAEQEDERDFVDALPSNFEVTGVSVYQNPGDAALSCSENPANTVKCELEEGAGTSDGDEREYKVRISVKVVSLDECGAVTNYVNEGQETVASDSVQIECAQVLDWTLNVCKLLVGNNNGQSLTNQTFGFEIKYGDQTVSKNISVDEYLPNSNGTLPADIDFPYDGGSPIKCESVTIPGTYNSATVTEVTQPAGWTNDQFGAGQYYPAKYDGVWVWNSNANNNPALSDEVTKEVNWVLFKNKGSVPPDTRDVTVCKVVISNGDSLVRGAFEWKFDVRQPVEANVVVTNSVAEPAGADGTESAEVCKTVKVLSGKVFDVVEWGSRPGTPDWVDATGYPKYSIDGGPRIANTTTSTVSAGTSAVKITFYNKEADRDVIVRIDKYLVNYGDREIGDDDFPTAFRPIPEIDGSDADPQAWFDANCEVIPNGVGGHKAWHCTVPAEWLTLGGEFEEVDYEGWVYARCNFEQIVAEEYLLPEAYYDFCNEPDNGDVEVIKVYPNGYDQDQQPFSGTIDGDGGSFNWSDIFDGTADGDVISDVPVGTYTVSESLVNGYELLGWGFSAAEACGEQAPTVAISELVTGEEGDTFKVQPGETTVIYVCNRPGGRVTVQKTFAGDFPEGDPFTFTENLPGTANQVNPQDNVTVEVHDQAGVAPGSYFVTEDQFLTEQEGCFGDEAAGYATTYRIVKNGVTIADGVEADTANFTVEAGDQITVTFINTRCEVLGSPQIFIQKFEDPAGDRSGTNSVGGFQVRVLNNGIEIAGSPFVVPAGGMLIPGLSAGTVEVLELNPNTGGWVMTGSKIDIDDNGTYEVSVGGQPPVQALDFGELIRFNLYNQPRVNIVVAKTIFNNANPAGANGGAGWTFTLSGCGVGPLQATTDATGTVSWNNLPPAVGCTYTVTETAKPGWLADQISKNTSPDEPGETATLGFINRAVEGCTNINNCDQVDETPTPTNTPVTPTNTPDTDETPTEDPTVDPTTEDPSETAIAGERTPGPGDQATPIAPDTGAGFGGSTSAGMNILLVIAGLIAISGGLSFIALGRKKA